MSNLVEIKVPDIGDFAEVEVIEILVNVGDTIAADQSLMTVESDKASMEIPASQGGVVKAIHIKVGDKVSEGSVVLSVEAAGAAAPAAVAPAPVAAPAAAAPAPVAAAAPAPAATSSGPVDVIVPDIGDFADVEVIEVLVNVGDVISQEQSLLTVESDKASMEIPSSHSGKVLSIAVKVGDRVNKGSVVLSIEASGGVVAQASVASAPAPVAASAPAAAPAAAAPAVARSSPTAAYGDVDLPLRDLPHASPSVRMFARELGVDLKQVKGTGEKHRIIKEDVKAFIKAAMSNVASTGVTTSTSAAGSGAGLNILDWPKVDFSKFGAIETKPLSRIKKISGANLHRNWVVIPHVTNNEEADITDLEAFRVQLNKEYEKAGVKFTMLAFLIKACVSALKKFPEFNASLDGDNLVLKQYYHIGFAADTPNGLVVPVIKDADKKSIANIAKEMSELAKLARDGKLSPAQMQGGCFSISSLGGIGGTSFTPIINAPEVAILGVSRSAMKPIWNGKEFAPRLMMPLSLSFDHRVIDGAAAAKFNAYLAQVLADYRRIAI